MFIMISCEKKSDNSNKKRGELYGECNKDKTCYYGLVCDTDYNICIKDPQNSVDNDEDKTDYADFDTKDDFDIDSTEDSDTMDDFDIDSTEDSDTMNDSDDEEPVDSCEGSNDKITLGNICTNQQYCYNMVSFINCPESDTAFYGQDAQYAELGICNPQSFTLKTVDKKKIIVDNNTGLEWQQKISTKNYTWSEAKKYCNELIYGGYSDWRLPDPQEFLTIVDGSKFNPAINSNFTNIAADDNIYLWTSRESRYFIVSKGLYSYYGTNTNSYNALCVRGCMMHGAVFESKTINDDVVVTDLTTGLIWQKKSDYKGNWENALKYCEELDYAGRTDWRLPNKNEAASLLNLDKSEAPYSDLPDIPVDGFWSSTTFRESSHSWLADSYSGRVFYTYKDEEFSALCVTSGNGVELSNPCDPNPCGSVANSTGECNQLSETLYSCGCNDGYYWWEAEKKCIDKKPLTLGSICTGQISCIDEYSSPIDCQQMTNSNYYGQDAQYASWGVCEPQSFTVETVTGEKIVVDNNTSLIWQRSPSYETYHWIEAQIYCTDLNISGYAGFDTGWRVPTPQELHTIVDNEKYDPVINSNFTNIKKYGCWWTSREYRGNIEGDEAYRFEYYSGKIVPTTKEDNCYVLCVHGSEMPTAVFTSETAGEDVVVTDSTTGLVWQKEYRSDFWKNALKYCEESEYAGRKDWRLPNKNELASLLNYDKTEVPYSDFPDMPETKFVSSTIQIINDKQYYLDVDFGNGRMDVTHPASISNFRCVAGGHDIKPANPCDPNPCGSIANSTGECRIVSETVYYCGCAEGYYWWETEKRCLDKKPPSVGRICTGQKLCYSDYQDITCPSSGEDFYGQDPQYAEFGVCKPQNFTVKTVAGQNIVVDNYTGLEWQQEIDEEIYNFENALDYCATLNYAGHSSGWRLPEPLELLTIVDNSRNNPAIDITNFPNMTNITYIWTSKIKGKDNIWALNPSTGSIEYRSKKLASNVMCVHGGKMPNAVFASETVNGKIVVTDLSTGLMWQKEGVSNGDSWLTALKYCEDSDYAGYTDWRLPNKNELASLLNYNKLMPPYSNFPDMSRYEEGNWFRSSSHIWKVDFYFGEVTTEHKSSFMKVRCVR